MLNNGIAEMPYSLLIYPPTAGHLGSFQGLATINKDIIEINVWVFEWT